MVSLVTVTPEKMGKRLPSMHDSLTCSMRISLFVKGSKAVSVFVKSTHLCVPSIYVGTTSY